MKKTKTIAVLMGGWNGEREVSLASGEKVATALEKAGYQTISIDVSRDLQKLIEKLNPAPDVVFNALHGRWGEDGHIQGVLEIMKIPYTSSGVMSSALAMNKPTAKTLFQAAGINCPKGFVTDVEAVLKKDPMPKPYVLKPLEEGSSIGVAVIQADEDLKKWHKNWKYGSRVMVEEYIDGREIQVAVIGDVAIGAIEIKPKQGFYDYEAKYTEGKAEHVMPAPLPEEDYQEVLDLALKAHKCLNCFGVSRADFRYNNKNEKGKRFYILEVNTQPGMTPLSLLPEIAAHQGMPFEKLLEWMVENPKCPD